MEKPTPRINGALRQRFVGTVVRLIGKVLKLTGTVAILEASDQTQVQVQLNRDAHLTDAYIEVIGKVNDDLSITAYSISNYGKDFDLSAHDSLVKIAIQHPEIFGPS